MGQAATGSETKKVDTNNKNFSQSFIRIIIFLKALKIQPVRFHNGHLYKNSFTSDNIVSFTEDIATIVLKSLGRELSQEPFGANT